MTPSERLREPVSTFPGPLRRAGRWALASSTAVAGWGCHDAAVYLTCGEPALTLAILPRTLLLAVLGGALGGLVELGVRLLPRVVVGALLVLALALSFAPLLPSAGPFGGPSVVLAGWMLAAAVLLALRFARGSLPAILLSSLALGALASVAFAELTLELEPRSFVVLGAALVCLASTRLAHPLARRSLAATTLVAGCAWIALAAAGSSRLSRTPLPRGEGPAPTAPNLVLVVLDTVRASHLAPYGYERQTTPLLDARVQDRAEHHTRAWSTSSWTLPSHASLFTGLFPSEHGATHPRGAGGLASGSEAAPAHPLRADVPTLAELLRERGWRTGAVLSNHGYLDPRYGLDRGFEHYDARPGGRVRRYVPLAQLCGLPLRAGHQSYRDARAITDLALRWLDEAPGERPFFLVVNYMDAHAPYLPPPPFDTAFGGPRIESAFRMRYADREILYDRSLAWLDSQLARLLDAVDDGNTVVIVTSDHGEALGGHGYWMHDWTLYEELVRVPLYVFPVRPRAQPTRDEQTSGADVFHIALAELGQGPAWTPRADGQQGEWFRVPEVPAAKVLADKDVERDLVAWIAWPRKVIVSSSGAVEAYDLALDPGESSPLDLPEAEREAARGRARRWWDEHPPPASAAPAALTPDELERLRELGYAGGG